MPPSGFGRAPDVPVGVGPSRTASAAGRLAQGEGRTRRRGGGAGRRHVVARHTRGSQARSSRDPRCLARNTDAARRPRARRFGGQDACRDRRPPARDRRASHARCARERVAAGTAGKQSMDCGGAPACAAPARPHRWPRRCSPLAGVHCPWLRLHVAAGRHRRSHARDGTLRPRCSAGRLRDPRATVSCWGLSAGYAHGLARRERWGITGNCQLGSMGSFRAIFCVYPTHRRAFFASYNSDPEEGNFDRVDSLIASALGVPQTAALATSSPGGDPAEWSGWYVVRPNRFQQFAYVDALMVTRIVWNGSTLELRPIQGAIRSLEPLGGPFFRHSGRREATHVISRSSDGVAIITDGLRGIADGRATAGDRVRAGASGAFGVRWSGRCA
jgi:hypothetical protein